MSNVVQSSGNLQGAHYDVQLLGGRKRTLRKRTRRGGRPAYEMRPWELIENLTLTGGRKRTLRKRTRRGGCV
jgi:hypothetical protein